MNARDFYRTAELLVNLPDVLEANFRSAISRAYYAPFVLIQNSVIKQVTSRLLKQAQLSSQLGHERVINALFQSTTAEISEIGKDLDNLRKARRCSDYDMAASVSKADALDALKLSAELLAAIDSFGLPKIIAYMIQHIRNLAQLRSGTSI